MGSCVSIHNNTASALKLQISSLDDSKILPNSNSNSIPSTPIKYTMDHKPVSPLDHSKVQMDSNSIPSPTIKDAMDDNNNKPPIPTPAIVDPRILSLRYKSQASRLSSGSIASYRSFGSKEEAFYDTHAWLESDCEDDFYSVNGDFSSRGSTPSHSRVGTPRVNRVFSPQVNQGRPPLRSESNLSRGSTPGHNRNSSSPLITGTYSEVVATTPNQDSSTAPKKKKKLADLFRESMRERSGELLGLEQGIESPKKGGGPSPNSPASVLRPRPRDPTQFAKITPADEYLSDRGKPLKSPQPEYCCFPRLASIRSFRDHKKTSNP